MCNKPQVKAEPLPAVPAEASRPAFRLPGSRPSEMDKRFLIWSGRFKTPEQIPDLVSHEMIDAARNKVRVKICFVMMGVTIGACLVMVLLGKRAARRHESLTAQNMERKVRWREELHEKEEAAVVLSQKAQ
ncbi:E2-induced 5 protein -like isoform 5 [Scophthalmus maximus]|nr:protein FAM162B isoform X2 [Scophthalmus maximus]AWP20614.1 E2-induced 5 protein -like [Scophthalmus maximus]AWP20615.1 E2-induced 5 protein -like isoform 2 [Scophthalmus maximus]AWP20616.1 E2-induced 5 protein -like isoform 3 [Scophthalmus maximus]AWP20618.1 E2-induced 5 protein -like isoform 5 [Scophthalmus maximus]